MKWFCVLSTIFWDWAISDNDRHLQSRHLPAPAISTPISCFRLFVCKVMDLWDHSDLYHLHPQVFPLRSPCLCLRLQHYQGQQVRICFYVCQRASNVHFQYWYGVLNRKYICKLLFWLDSSLIKKAQGSQEIGTSGKPRQFQYWLVGRLLRPAVPQWRIFPKRICETSFLRVSFRTAIATLCWSYYRVPSSLCTCACQLRNVLNIKVVPILFVA